MLNHTAIQYAVLYTSKSQGKRYAELTGSVDTLTEALADARTHRADGHGLMGLVQIDYITNAHQTIRTGKDLEDQFDAEDEATYFSEHATERDIDFLDMTERMSLAAEATE